MDFVRHSLASRPASSPSASRAHVDDFAVLGVGVDTVLGTVGIVFCTVIYTLTIVVYTLLCVMAIVFDAMLIGVRGVVLSIVA